jgi:hypothetical protein
LKAAEKAGGHLDEYPQEDLYSLSVDFGGDAYCVVKQRVASAADGVGPLVLSTFSEPAGWMGTSRCPTEELWLAAQSEASSIVYHYSPFTANDLKDIKYPYIPGPLRNPPILVRYPNVEVALHAALERLEQLNDPVNFPVISSLAAGAYVSTVVIQEDPAKIQKTLKMIKNSSVLLFSDFP